MNTLALYGAREWAALHVAANVARGKVLARMQRGGHDGRLGARAGEDGEEEPAAFELHEGGQHCGAGMVLYTVLRARSYLC
jgi:hypothetical protein